MAGRTVSITDVIRPDALATQIANQFVQWNSLRNGWKEEKKELRNYVFQTSTADTTNSSLPWKNSTATPKLCQIRDNLHANYMAALFPNENWLNWIGADKNSELEAKRVVIEHYMRNKTEASNFRATVSQLIYDWIDTGNCFATVVYKHELLKDTDTNTDIVQYSGPSLIRISPYDIVFNPISATFNDSPKIIRSIKSLGDIAKDVEDHPELSHEREILQKMMENRRSLSQVDISDVDKNDGFQVDGFSSFTDYFSSGMVEILEFYGDIWDVESGTLLSNHVVTVVDRSLVFRKTTIPGWNKNKIRHVGWRLRPDNLYAMGPLDNLVGMQYRIDHLENLKADVFDLIAHPVIKIRGFVEDFDYGPGERIILGDDGDVSFMPPDTTALNADLQIKILEDKMEEFAGAPKQAMGIRTPGEKTALEVQVLENAAGRIFQNKISYFEQMFLEPLLNDMLEVARRNLQGTDIIRVMDDEIDVALFQQITAEELKANGRLRPIGSRHFATKANMLQNFLGIANSAIGQDPAVNIHLSGIAIAQMVEDLLGLKKFQLVGNNIRVIEQMETQRLVNAGREQLDTEMQVDAGVVPEVV
jgi:hypothetical protein